MHELFYLSDRSEVILAQQLIAEYGADAGFEAAERADHSRQVGNHIHFCRWRQIERLILVLATDEPVGTVH